MRLTLTVPALILSSLLLAAPAHGQWRWVDENGRVTYSDQPPPTSIPASRVTQIGTGTSGRAAAPQAAGTANATEAQPAAQSWADRALEARRRQADKEAAERKAQDQAQATDSLSRFCDGARADLRTLESGMRIARVRADGEREFISDEEREGRIGLLQREIRAKCPSS